VPVHDQNVPVSVERGSSMLGVGGWGLYDIRTVACDLTVLLVTTDLDGGLAAET
jgi:hypothetical protein